MHTPRRRDERGVARKTLIIVVMLAVAGYFAYNPVKMHVIEYDHRLQVNSAASDGVAAVHESLQNSSAGGVSQALARVSTDRVQVYAVATSQEGYCIIARWRGPEHVKPVLRGACGGVVAPPY